MPAWGGRAPTGKSLVISMQVPHKDCLNHVHPQPIALSKLIFKLDNLAMDSDADDGASGPKSTLCIFGHRETRCRKIRPRESCRCWQSAPKPEATQEVKICAYERVGGAS